MYLKRMKETLKSKLYQLYQGPNLTSKNFFKLSERINTSVLNFTLLGAAIAERWLQCLINFTKR